MKAQKILLPIIAVIGALVFFSIFIVKEVNQAIVLQFGDPKKIIIEPGLNFKLPFIQNVVFLDSRILNLDTPPAEVIASDQKRLIVDAFARFQIIDPLKFYISVGNERVARSRLSTIINSRIRNVLGQQELQTLLSKDRSKQMALIQEGVNAEAQKILQAAEAYKKQVVAKAEGEASRFVSIFNEYDKAKEVTQERMYLETMEKVLADIEKVIIEKNAGSGVVPYLPLPELNKKKVTN